MRHDRALVRSLNRLIAGLYDTIGQYDAAAEHAHSFGSYAEYQHDVTLRREIARRLSRRVTQLGGVPRRSGTIGGWFKRCVVHVLGVGVANEMWVLRLFEREERHLMLCLKTLIADRQSSPGLRHELSSILAGLGEELDRLRHFHGRKNGAQVVR